MNENTGYEHKLITYTNNFSLNVIICNLFFVCAKSEEVFRQMQIQIHKRNTEVISASQLNFGYVYENIIYYCYNY